MSGSKKWFAQTICLLTSDKVNLPDFIIYDKCFMNTNLGTKLCGELISPSFLDVTGQLRKLYESKIVLGSCIGFAGGGEFSNKLSVQGNDGFAIKNLY